MAKEENLEKSIYNVLSVILGSLTVILMILLGVGSIRGSWIILLITFICNAYWILQIILHINEIFKLLFSVFLLLQSNVICLIIAILSNTTEIPSNLLNNAFKLILFNQNNFSDSTSMALDTSIPFSTIFAFLGYLFWALVIAAFSKFKKITSIKLKREVIINDEILKKIDNENIREIIEQKLKPVKTIESISKVIKIQQLYDSGLFSDYWFDDYSIIKIHGHRVKKNLESMDMVESYKDPVRIPFRVKETIKFTP